MPRTAVLAVTVIAAALCPRSATAQPTNDVPVWALAGVDAVVDPRWSTVLRAGYLGGFHSRLLLADVTFAPDEAWRLVVGYLFVDPLSREPAATSVVRGGAVWRPLRGRFSLENRLLTERLFGRARRPAGRFRDRVTASVTTGDRLRLRLFASAEWLVVREAADAHRFQIGSSRAFGRTTLEACWTHHHVSSLYAFNTLGLTYVVRVGPP